MKEASFQTIRQKTSQKVKSFLLRTAVGASDTLDLLTPSGQISMKVHVDVPAG